MAELADELGGLDSMPPSDRALLMQACEVLISRPRRHVDQVRGLRIVDRLLTRLRANAEARKPKPQTLAELLRAKP
jgi:hypothetical protein